MNLETLKAKINQTQSFTWLGETVYLRKLGAADGFALFGRLEDVKAKTLSAEDDGRETADFYATLVSKCLCDESGTLTLDSDEGRTALKLVDYRELRAVGVQVMEFNGIIAEDTKKNSLTTSDSPTDSPATLAASIPITS